MIKKTPCIVYLRCRFDQPRANHFAGKQQDAAEQTLGERGFEIVGRYGDEEFAPPFAGYLEPRPAWQMALDAAAEVCIARGSCSLVVLRPNGIGMGDPFIPDSTLLAAYERVDIRVYDFSLTDHPTDISLAAAHRYLAAFIEAEKKQYEGHAIALGRSVKQHDIILRRDPFRQIVRAYFSNYREDAAQIKFKNYRRGPGSYARWPPAVPWVELDIPPRSAVHLHSFIQGDPSNEVNWWRFKIGEKRETKVGNKIIVPHDLAAPSLAVEWYPYEPDDLGPADFHWEHAPRIETERLMFRNWRKGDLQRYEAICSSPEVMQFLGGQLDPQEVLDDLDYFRELGQSGPTYWAVEQKVDGQLIGFCGILVVEEDETCVTGEWEIGWRFAPSAHGIGLAFEAACAVVRAAFEEWGFSRIVCRIHSDNIASRRLAERLGLAECFCESEAEMIERPCVLFQMTEQMFLEKSRGPAALNLQ